MQEELLTFEQEFTQAVAANDAAAIRRFVADDWVIVDADGNVIDRSRFISVVESGALIHESMESTDVEVRVHGDTAVVTGITTSKGQFMGQALPRGSARPMFSHGSTEVGYASSHSSLGSRRSDAVVRFGAPCRVQSAKELWATTDAFQRRGGNPRVVKPELRRDTQW